MKKIIAFSGSNNPNSINQQLIHIVANFVDAAELEVLNLRDYPAIMYGMEEEAINGFPETMESLQVKMKEADGFIVASPEHNGSMTAVLKNTIDWLSRIEGKVFNDKPTVFLSTSPGERGGASVLQHLLAIMPYQGAKIVGGYGLGSFYEKVIDNKLVDGDDKTNLQALMDELSRAVNNV